MSLQKADERTLIKSYLDGNQSSLQILIERYQQRLYSYIMMMVRKRELADDIFQDTFVKIINTLKSGNYKDEGKFIQWAMRIAHNLVIDHFRKSKKMPVAESKPNQEDRDIFDTIGITDPSVEEKMVIDQIHSDVKKLIQYLPDEQKEVLFLRCYAGLSFKEIAEQTDVSINTALGRMRYAVLNLRKLVEEHDIVLTR